LSLKVLLGFLYQGICGIEEPRKASNATRYSLRDPILGALSAFFMQCESFLEHQRQMQSRQGKNNAQTLFGVTDVLKTKGYHFEHSFGHGQDHLASFLLTLNLLAFLFHTVLALVDQSYQRIRRQRGTRKGFFQDILALTKYLLFESWQHLLDFMIDDSPGSPAQNTS
jgi:hypothetical protein